MKCVDCGYYWKEENEDYAQCHFVPYFPEDYSPCEQEDIDRHREIEEQEWEDFKRQIEEEEMIEHEKMR